MENEGCFGPDSPQCRAMVQEEASKIAILAAQEAVKQTFAMLGVDLSKFEALQQFRDDLEWARKSRRLSEATGQRLWGILVGVFGAGAVLALWEGFKILAHK